MSATCCLIKATNADKSPLRRELEPIQNQMHQRLREVYVLRTLVKHVISLFPQAAEMTLQAQHGTRADIPHMGTHLSWITYHGVCDLWLNVFQSRKYSPSLGDWAEGCPREGIELWQRKTFKLPTNAWAQAYSMVIASRPQNIFCLRFILAF